MAQLQRCPAEVNRHTRICCLTRGESWVAPPAGRACGNRQHGHLSLGKVEELMALGCMEMVKGIYVTPQGAEVETWIPVARFLDSRRWARRVSVDPRMRAGMVTMQLVAG